MINLDILLKMLLLSKLLKVTFVSLIAYSIIQTERDKSKKELYREKE